MNSEKVKEIKEKLQEEVELGKEYCLTHRRVGVDDLCDILTLINELESENEKLNSRYINLEINYNNIWEHYREYGVENQQLKDRIAELENGIAKSMLGCEFLPECNNEKLKQFAERVKMEFFYEFDEIIPSIMADKINKLVEEFLTKK